MPTAFSIVWSWFGSTLVGDLDKRDFLKKECYSSFCQWHPRGTKSSVRTISVFVPLEPVFVPIWFVVLPSNIVLSILWKNTVFHFRYKKVCFLYMFNLSHHILACL